MDANLVNLEPWQAVAGDAQFVRFLSRSVLSTEPTRTVCLIQAGDQSCVPWMHNMVSRSRGAVKVAEAYEAYNEADTQSTRGTRACG
jgi:hypothetical protein